MSESEPDDSSLLAQWLSRGCERSFRLLVERYAGLVHHAAKRRSGDDSIAAEASQATFILLARKAKSLAGRQSLAGWLHVTAVHQSRNLQRRQMRETRKRQRLGEQSDPGAGAAWDHMQPELDLALAKLSPPDREALLLRYYRSLSVKEVAASLGVTVEAAQKRLLRATERLRGRLSSRGCTMSATAIAAGLVGLAGDAKAGTVLAQSLGTKALAAAATTSPFVAITTVILMTKKTAIIAGAAVLLGVGTYAIIHESSEKKPTTAISDQSTARSGGKDASNASTSSPGAAGDASSRKRPEGAWPDLTARYGDSRTKLANHVVQGFLTLLDDLALIGEMAEGHEGVDVNAGGELGDLKGKLNLSEEQSKAAEALLKERSKKELAKLKTLSGEFRKNPRDLVETMLASDAYARKEISKEEYQATTRKAMEVLKGDGSMLAGLGGGKSADKGNPLMNDPELRGQFESLLSTEQKQAFQAEAENEKPAEVAATDDISELLPPMELEKMEQTLTSTQQMMTGMKQMLEGMKTLPPGVLTPKK